MRLIWIDRFPVRVTKCCECPVADEGDDGYGAHCQHPMVCEVCKCIGDTYRDKVDGDCPLYDYDVVPKPGDYGIYRRGDRTYLFHIDDGPYMGYFQGDLEYAGTMLRTWVDEKGLNVFEDKWLTISPRFKEGEVELMSVDELEARWEEMCDGQERPMHMFDYWIRQAGERSDARRESR